MANYNNPTGAKEIYGGIISILIVMHCKCIGRVIALYSPLLSLFWKPVSLQIIKCLLYFILECLMVLFINSSYGNGIAQL